MPGMGQILLGPTSMQGDRKEALARAFESQTLCWVEPNLNWMESDWAVPDWVAGPELGVLSLYLTNFYAPLSSLY